MKFQIKTRFSNKVKFECDIDASFESKSYRVQLGAAVKKAVEAGAYLSRADLAGADLAGANLAGADLAGANLAGANLAGANLAGADLAGANLADADLADAYLADADLAGASKVKSAEVPVISQIDVKILAAIEAGGNLDMGSWHGRDGVCGTTHCRAGWAVHLAGEEGRALEEKIGTKWAATEIYRKSRPGQKTPWFFDTNEGAMADLRKCAAEQAAVAKATGDA